MRKRELTKEEALKRIADTRPSESQTATGSPPGSLALGYNSVIEFQKRELILARHEDPLHCLPTRAEGLGKPGARTLWVVRSSSTRSG
jgi:hypothetical protein